MMGIINVFGLVGGKKIEYGVWNTYYENGF
jgi:hypothetical protein